MLMFVLVALTVILSSAEALDKTRIMDQPPPMKGFAIRPSLGRWFVTYRSASCSWSGSSEFADFEQTLSLDGDTVLLKESWRNDLCSTITSRMFIQKELGVYKVKDPMGNAQSGVLVVPVINYKSFSISWACTKFAAIGNRCDDPSVSVKTRFAFPGPGTIAQINAALKDLWGISIDHLQKVKHEKSCVSGHGYGPHAYGAQPQSGYGAHGHHHSGHGSSGYGHGSYAESDDGSSKGYAAHGHGHGHGYGSKKGYNY